MDNTVLVTAWVRAFVPDRPVRKNNIAFWKPNPFEFRFDHNSFDGLPVVLEVPVKHEYIHNTEEILQAQLGFADIQPDPIFTLDGWRYIQDKIEDVMKDENPTEPDNVFDEEDNNKNEVWN